MKNVKLRRCNELIDWGLASAMLSEGRKDFPRPLKEGSLVKQLLDPINNGLKDIFRSVAIKTGVNSCVNCIDTESTI